MRQKEVFLPPSCTASEMHKFFSELLTFDLKPLSEEFTLNFSSLKFVKPSGVTALANVTELLLRCGCILKYSCPRIVYDRKNPVCFLDDCGFFDRYIRAKIHPLSRTRETTIPLKSIPHEFYVGWVENEIIPWLDKCLEINTAKQFPELRVCLDEIFNNIKDHSGCNIANAFMQYYPKKKIIDIAISDSGTGIPFNVRKVCPGLADEDALKEAVAEGFSSKSSPRNRGSGLDTLIENVANNNCGHVTFLSYHGKLICRKEEAGVKKLPYRFPFYPGTLINIVLKTDMIQSLEAVDEEDFSW